MNYRENGKPCCFKRVFWSHDSTMTASRDVAERVRKFLDALSNAGVPFGNIIVTTGTHICAHALGYNSF